MNKLCYALAGGVVLLAACKPAYEAQQAIRSNARAPSAEVGRFQLLQAEYQIASKTPMPPAKAVFRIDTQTGKTWVHRYSWDEENKKILEAWIPIEMDPLLLQKSEQAVDR